MAIYAIGDLQGCLDSYLELLDLLAPAADDQIWLTGDLVNRGPQSLETLRYIKNQGTQVVSVLGNHDLHLLALASGRFSDKPNPTLQPILRAEDRDELLDWLIRRPLLHRDDAIGWVLVHAGIHPSWDIELATRLASEIEGVLKGDNADAFIHDMYGNHPDNWEEDLEGNDRLRFIVNVFTRMRFCDREGRLDFLHKGSIGDQGPDLFPWFELLPKNLSHRVVFGHWSALGRGGNRLAVGVDTGCLWGGRLTALRLDANPVTEIGIECPQHKKVQG